MAIESHVQRSHTFSQQATLCGPRRGGFSIVELLVVIFIIVLIIAITVPALSGVRNSAKKTESQQLLANLAQGVAAFTLDENRSPGYFSPADMGSADNVSEGMSGMQNIMLDMMGGFAAQNAPAGPSVIDVGPVATANRKVRIDLGLIGRATTGEGKVYWNLPAKVFERTDPNTGRPLDTGLPRRRSNDEHNAWREIVDAFGGPVLAWSMDDALKTTIKQPDDFARIATDTTGAEKARVYWNSNSAFLSRGVFVGQRQINQAGGAGSADDQPNQSMLFEARTAEDRQITMMGLLANPGSPRNPAETNEQDVMPTAPLAPVVFHSAGRDGTFLAKSDAGGKRSRATGSGPVLDYGRNIKDKLVEKFDDIVQAAN